MKNDTIQTRNRIAGLFYGEAEHTRDRETRRRDLSGECLWRIRIS